MRFCHSLPAALLFSCLVQVAVSLGSGRARAQAPKPKPLTPEQQQQLTEGIRHAVEALRLWDAGKQAEAIAAWEMKLAIERKVLGDVSETVARSLDQLAEWDEFHEDLAAARKARQEVLVIEIILHGAKHWRVTDATLALEDTERLAQLDDDQRRQLREALLLTRYSIRQQSNSVFKSTLGSDQRAGEIRRQILGENHRDYATSLNQLALAYRVLGEYPKAQDLLEQACKLRKRLLGEDHPAYANSLYNLATLYEHLGNYAKAQPLLERYLGIIERLLTKHDPRYAITLSNLAVLYQAIGEYSKALPLFEEALDLTEKHLTKNHPEYASRLANLAVLYQDMGEYGKARPLFEQALRLAQRRPTSHAYFNPSRIGAAPYAAMVPPHPYLTSLYSLCRLYLQMGDYAKAKPLFEQAYQRLNQSYLTEGRHEEYITSLAELAGLCKEMGYSSGLVLRMCEVVRDLTKKRLGENHPRYARSLDNLAMAYSDVGDYHKALLLEEEALALERKLGMRDHTLYATTLGNLAMLYRAAGDNSKALGLLKQACDLTKRRLTENHPDYARALGNLGLLYLAIRR